MILLIQFIISGQLGYAMKDTKDAAVYFARNFFLSILSFEWCD